MIRGKKNTLLYLLLIIITISAFILRFYKLGEIPSGLYQDETAIGYNAYSIIQTGKDEHGVSFPLYFKSFGDYKLPIYIYLTVFSVKLFGLSAFAVRFPSALFSVLTIPAFYLLIRKLTKSNKLYMQYIPLTATGLLAINPWHIHYARATFEVSIALFLFVFGAYLLACWIRDKTKGAFLLGTLMFITALYSYNLTRLLSPFLYIWTIWFYTKVSGVGKSRWNIVKQKEIALTAILSLFLLIPFTWSFLSPGGASSASGTLLFTSAFVQAPLLEFRSYLIHLPYLFVSGLFNKWVATIWLYFQNIASYLSADFFFVSGSSHGNHGIGTVGQFYLVELLFIITGLFVILKRRIRWGFYAIGWVVLTIIVAALTREAPHATRSFFLTAPFAMFSALGLVVLIGKIKHIRRVWLKGGLLLGLCAILLYGFVYYLASYYVRFPVSYAASWRYADKELSEYIFDNIGNYDQVFIDTKAGFVYTSYLFYNAVDPESVHRTAVWEAEDSEGFSFIKSIGALTFDDVDWNSGIPSNSLVVVSPGNKPQNYPIIKSFYYPERPVVIADGQTILAYPVKTAAYHVIEVVK